MVDIYAIKAHIYLMATKADIKEYFKRISPGRIKLSGVLEDMRPFVAAYQANYDDNDAISCNAHHNAMISVFRLCEENKRAAKVCGNCPRCGGFGIINAFKHIEGGVCFECGGTGNIS